MNRRGGAPRGGLSVSGSVTDDVSLFTVGARIQGLGGNCRERMAARQPYKIKCYSCRVPFQCNYFAVDTSVLKFAFFLNCLRHFSTEQPICLPLYTVNFCFLLSKTWIKGGRWQVYLLPTHLLAFRPNILVCFVYLKLWLGVLRPVVNLFKTLSNEWWPRGIRWLTFNPVTSTERCRHTFPMLLLFNVLTRPWGVLLTKQHFKKWSFSVPFQDRHARLQLKGRNKIIWSLLAKLINYP